LWLKREAARHNTKTNAAAKKIKMMKEDSSRIAIWRAIRVVSHGVDDLQFVYN